MKNYTSQRASFTLLMTVLALALVLGGNVARADGYTAALSLGSNYVPVTVDELESSTWTPTSVGGGPITISSLNSSPLAWVYCVGFYIDVPVPFDYTNTTVTSDGFVDGAYVNNDGEIAWLLDHFAASAAGNTNDEQALQAAIWSVEYNGTTGNGNPIEGDPNAAYYSKYQSDLTALGSNTDPLGNVYWFSPSTSSGGEYQGLVGNDNGAVPEPASILLLGTLLLGVLHLLKRKLAPSRQ